MAKNWSKVLAATGQNHCRERSIQIAVSGQFKVAANRWPRSSSNSSEWSATSWAFKGLIVDAGSYCPGVGQNKRYAAYYARLMDDRIEEFVMHEELIMLTAVELDVENCRPTDFPEPRRVYSWIRYPSKAIRVQAHAIAYTQTAVEIRFLEPLIKIHGRVGYG